MIGGEPRKSALFRGEGGWDIPPERALPDKALAALCAGRPVRRLGRLTRLALAATLDAAPADTAIDGIFYGTGWGALSETHDFLSRLWASGGEFSSPTAFAASVHNAVAGQLAIAWQARGANLTAVGRRDALAQAALLAALVGTPRPAWLVAADAYHAELTPRLEGDYAEPEGGTLEADGAAALLVTDRPHPDAIARLRVLELAGVALPTAAPATRAAPVDAVLHATPAAGTETDADQRAGADQRASADQRAGAALGAGADAKAGAEHGADETAAPWHVALHRPLGRHASVAGQGVALAVRALQRGALPAGLAVLAGGTGGADGAADAGGGGGAEPRALFHGRLHVRSADSLLSVEAP